MKQEKLLAELARVIERACATENNADGRAVEMIGEQIAKSFGCESDEVAILRLDHADRALQFLHPKQLRPIGTIPLSSTGALAAKTARERKAELANNFASIRHATVFEGVPMGRRDGESIHKIMSAPITSENRVVGVVQVSRKGRNPVDAGPDFTAQDLRSLVALGGALGEFLLNLQPS